SDPRAELDGPGFGIFPLPEAGPLPSCLLAARRVRASARIGGRRIRAMSPAAPRIPARAFALAALALAIVAACARPAREAPRPERAAPPARSAVVTATAYTSRPNETQGDPFVTAS